MSNGRHGWLVGFRKVPNIQHPQLIWARMREIQGMQISRERLMIVLRPIAARAYDRFWRKADKSDTERFENRRQALAWVARDHRQTVFDSVASVFESVT